MSEPTEGFTEGVLILKVKLKDQPYRGQGSQIAAWAGEMLAEAGSHLNFDEGETLALESITETDVKETHDSAAS
jgi:hypothetical protein